MRPGWVWRRWQLVAVTELPNEVVVDAIDLTLGPLDDAGGLVTLAFVADDDAEDRTEDLAPRLRRWVRSDNGLCDAFLPLDEPTEQIAMLQGTDLLVVAAGPPS